MGSSNGYADKADLLFLELFLIVCCRSGYKSRCSSTYERFTIRGGWYVFPPFINPLSESEPKFPFGISNLTVFVYVGSSDQKINQVVSGALDRLQSTSDPPVKFDPDQKLWIYRHRLRTANDFSEGAADM